MCAPRGKLPADALRNGGDVSGRGDLLGDPRAGAEELR